jgi:hypothetical protein
MENRVPRKASPNPAVLAAKVIESKCPICGSESIVSDPEKLCWVCRRLKVSAWRDSDHSMPIQE